ncbi:8991_t:CDS:2 [Funneliformis geosporum]|nr:8991_t:CDS:2 [Funneliformis geosporum]
MNIESFHIIPDRRWEGTVYSNRDKSLIAVYLTADYLKYERKSIKSWIYVLSVKNGLQISSSEKIFSYLDTEILVLYSCHGYKIEYTIIYPYDLSYECKGEFEIKESIYNFADGIQNYMIMEDNLQYKLMLSNVDQIVIVNFSIPEDKINELYYKMEHDHNLIIISSFNEIKNSCYTHGGFSRDANTGHYFCIGKKLRWEFQNHEQMYGLLVYKVSEMQDQKFHIELDRDLHFRNLKILSNDDIVFYSDYEVHIFGFNEKHVPFCKTLQIPSIKLLSGPTFKDKLDLINEILSSRKNLIEMSDDIIEHAVNRMGNETICGIITKYLKKLNLVFPTHYSKFLYITSFIPNPCVHKSYLSDKERLIGYTEHAYTGQIYKYKFIQKFWNYIHRINFYNFLNIQKNKKARVISFIIPYFGFTSCSTEYNFCMDIIKPSDNQFVTLDDQAFYDSWNAEALLNFKWHTFGKFYYLLSWLLFTMFVHIFVIGTTFPDISNYTRNIFLRISIIFGVYYVFHEIRKIIWNWRRYFKDQWNWFDLAAYNVSLYTAIFWLYFEKPSLQLISLSILLLYFKFITFLRALDYFGSNFLSLLDVYNLNEPSYNDDPNNPWNHIQKPDFNSKPFTSYRSSLLTGDSSASFN